MEGELKTSIKFANESLLESRRGSSSLNLSGVGIEEEIEHDSINVDEL